VHENRAERSDELKERIGRKVKVQRNRGVTTFHVCKTKRAIEKTALILSEKRNSTRKPTTPRKEKIVEGGGGVFPSWIEGGLSNAQKKNQNWDFGSTNRSKRGHSVKN